MAILDEVKATIKDALKARDQVRLDAARMAQAALKNREIELGVSLGESDAQKVIATLIKQRNEAAVQFRKGQRAELAEKEEAEATFLQTLLPPPLSDDEIKQIIEQVLADTGVSGPGDLGKVMKPVMAAIAGRADGAKVRQLVQACLSQ